MADLDERRAWIALATVDGVGPETFAVLLADFGSPLEVIAAGRGRALRRWAQRRREHYGRAPITRPVMEHLAGLPDAAAEPLHLIDELGLWTLIPPDADYPSGLRDLDPPPPLIVGLGERGLLGAPRSVAIVGTRRPTPAGRMLAGRIAARLVECRAVVVSGLAVGIDGAAHAATVERGGQALAVIGGGHRHAGPRAHAALRGQIITSGGAIVSEYAPDVRPTRGTYPRRNRIIAALGDATLVVEAPQRSGALITARHALELGRPVLVAPGRIGDWSVAGSLALLHETPARILAGLDEMTDELGYLSPPETVTQAGAPSISAALAMLGVAERAVAERLARSPAGLDVLVSDTGLAPSVVSGAVTLLLMRGWVQPVGPAYVAAGPLLRP